MITDTRTAELQTLHDALVERLTLLSNDLDLDEGQRELAGAWRNRLEALQRRALARLSVAFLAQVGQGKSTLIAAATGLRLDVEGSPKRWSVLPVGDGRTTLGEIRVSFEERDDILLEVEPMSRGELSRELSIFAADLWVSKAGKGGHSGGAGQAGEELNDLLRVWLAPGDDDPRAVLSELARAAVTAAELGEMLLARVDLDLRTRPFARVFANTDNGLTVLQAILRDLMRGELAAGPVPQVTRLSVPMTELGRAIDTVIDTQGIDSSAPALAIQARPDLAELLRDPDTLLVVCSGFESAPDVVCRTVLEALADKGGVPERACRLLIVDRRELDDDPNEQRRQTRLRAERVYQCADQLRHAKLSGFDNSIISIDARREAEALQRELVGMSDEERQRRLDEWEQTYQDASEAISTLQEAEFAVEARELDLRLWWAWDAAMAEEGFPERNLGLGALAWAIENSDKVQHWSHLNATVRRRGLYPKLNLVTLGGRYAAILDTQLPLRARRKVDVLVAEISNELGERQTKHLELRRDHFGRALNGYCASLTNAWRPVIADYFASPQSDELWSWCEARWGQGSGYVQAVANRIRQASASAKLEQRADLLPQSLEASLPPRPPLFSLRNVELRNFRGVEHRSLALTPTTTVLIGDNGLGKTCWLEAIAAAVATLLPGVGAGPARPLTERDVRHVVRDRNGVPDRQHQLPMHITVEAIVQGRALPWTRRIDQLPSETAIDDDDALQVMARQIGEEVRAHSDRQLPILAYYGTQRLWPNLEPDIERGEAGSRLDGYRDCLEAASTHGHMLTWMRKFTMVQVQRKQPVLQLGAIERAVVACIDEAESFEYDLALEDLTLTMRSGEVIPFRMLSDGYRNVVAMVADIAWRASVLNPQLGAHAPALAEGVVLIDEIDLHLHPKWQRRVLADLRRAFPRLQFIATTHSPFIIQSLRPGQLLNLDPGAEDVPYADQSPEDIAEHIMGVKVPQRSERRRKEADAAMRYYDLLDQLPTADEGEIARLKAELDELTAPYAENQAFVAFLDRKRALAEATLS